MESFAEIVERNVASYQPARGRVETATRWVDNPAVAARMHLRAQRADELWTTAAGIMLLGPMVVALLGAVVGIIGLAPDQSPPSALIWAGVGSMVAAFPVCGGSAALHERRIYGGIAPKVKVPSDVALADQAFRAVPARLRSLGAAEDVVASVEDQSAAMDAMVTEIARLTALDAADTADGIDLRDRVVRLSAQAQALVELDRRRARLSTETSQAKGLLAQPAARLDGAAHRIAAETEHLERVLDACAADVVLPATLERGLRPTQTAT